MPVDYDPAVARERSTWTAVGRRGVCFKRLDDPYSGGVRSWRKHTVRVTTAALIGTVTPPLTAPRGALVRGGEVVPLRFLS
ncbi:hypothetical protein [Streptomyces acidicola]|uniref:ATP-dependent DNA ligase family profile domain-containing protein n=1 Tax=Streptomyces acidicola TaxID=2596892 RepID=A0A5N8X0Q6_9ACTN|nr:hypothetical protein [Streptomyces acidicola]MPY53203.1 hypothetical protein [Streptomyces acidicola]